VFTGIVEEVGAVRELRRVGDAVTLSIAATSVLEGTALGDSIAVDGACLTVTSIEEEGFTVGLSPETLRRTTLGEAEPGLRVNLERALAAGARLGGHFVQGHVDGVGTIVSIQREGDSLVITFELPPEMGRYVVFKGFIAVDGISLTVTERRDDRFAVALVAYTQTHVALLDKRPGERVNLEADIIAKYVESIVGGRRPGGEVYGQVAALEP
jgi:riboflavin synthase